MINNELRKPATIREEISDLSKYLNGIPAKLKAKGAFFAYEERLKTLRSELAESLARTSKASPKKKPSPRVRIA